MKFGEITITKSLIIDSWKNDVLSMGCMIKAMYRIMIHIIDTYIDTNVVNLIKHLI